ncbi:hypothetical protein SOVF_189880 [Spinacia oleracea]|nr:hypothetical protein SOVF_189880 [Spinacia oleracea]
MAEHRGRQLKATIGGGRITQRRKEGERREKIRTTNHNNNPQRTSRTTTTTIEATPTREKVAGAASAAWQCSGAKRREKIERRGGRGRFLSCFVFGTK